MFGLLAVAGDVGCSVGPWLTGVVSDAVQNSSAVTQLAVFEGLDPAQAGLKSGILVGALFPLAMAVLLISTRNRSRDTVL